MHKLKLACALVAAAAVYGCASAPSTEAIKSETAGYTLPKLPDGGKAMVYVVRPSVFGMIIRFNVFLDDQEEKSEVGYTRGSQYIYFSIPPGEHKIYSKAGNTAEIGISAKPGEIVFLQQDVSMGLAMADNSLTRIDEGQGKYYVKTLSVGTLIKPDYSGPMPTGTAAAKPAGLFGTPLPDNVVVSQAGADVPARKAAFVGAWAGRWANGQDHTLIVEKIDGKLVPVIYSWGVSMGGDPGFTRLQGAFADDGRLQAGMSNGATVSYRVSADGKALNATWEREGQRVEGVLQRRQIAMLPPPPPPGAAKVATLGASNVFGTPLPDTVRLQKPGADVPPALAAYAGIWSGKWVNGLNHTLVVERIEGRKANIIYSWSGEYTLLVAGPTSRARAYIEPPKPGFSRVDAQFDDDGSLQAKLPTGASVVYRIGADGKTMNGEYVLDLRRIGGDFQHRELP